MERFWRRLAILVVAMMALAWFALPASAAPSLYQSEMGQTSAESTDQSADASSVEQSTQEATEVATEDATEVSTQTATEVPTEPVNDSTGEGTQVPTDVPTQVETQAPTQVATDDVPTESINTSLSAPAPQSAQMQTQSTEGEGATLTGSATDNMVTNPHLSYAGGEATVSFNYSFAVDAIIIVTVYDISDPANTVVSTGPVTYAAGSDSGSASLPIVGCGTIEASIRYDNGGENLAQILTNQESCGGGSPTETATATQTATATATASATATDEPGYTLDITWDNCQVTVTPHGYTASHLGIVTLNGVELQGRLYVKDGFTTVLYDEDDLKNGDTGTINGEPFGPVTGCTDSTETPTSTATATATSTSTPSVVPATGTLEVVCNGTGTLTVNEEATYNQPEQFAQVGYQIRGDGVLIDNGLIKFIPGETVYDLSFDSSSWSSYQFINIYVSWQGEEVDSVDIDMAECGGGSPTATSTTTPTTTPTQEPTVEPTTPPATPTDEPGQPSCAAPISFVDGTAPNIADISPDSTFHASFQLQGGVPNSAYELNVSIASFQNGVRYDGQTVKAEFNDNCVADFHLEVKVPSCNFRVVIALGPSPENYEGGYAHVRTLVNYEGTVMCDDDGTVTPPTVEPTNPPVNGGDEGSDGNDGDNGSGGNAAQPEKTVMASASETVSEAYGDNSSDSTPKADGTTATKLPVTGFGSAITDPDTDSNGWIVGLLFGLAGVIAIGGLLVLFQDRRRYNNVNHIG